MKRIDIVKGWLSKAEKDINTAKDLYKSKHYDWCLFIWHLIIEKILKTKLVSLDKSIIYTHDLTRLAKEADLHLTKEEIFQFDEISTFNVAARYDDIKSSFYKKATQAYARKWVKICEEIYYSVKKNL